MTSRYDNLMTVVDAVSRHGQRHLRYLEVGTYTGERTERLLRHWLRRTQGTADYVGFDLFEMMTPEKAKEELGKTVPAPNVGHVLTRLGQIAKATIHLVVGDSREMLPIYVREHQQDPPFDLIFLDGGNSLETTESDWSAVQTLLTPQTVILLDDYFENRDDKGCALLVRRLQQDARYRVTLLDPVERYEHTGVSIRFARVTLAPH